MNLNPTVTVSKLGLLWSIHIVPVHLTEYTSTWLNTLADICARLVFTQ